MRNKLGELKEKMEKAKGIALSARVNNGVIFKYTKIIDDEVLIKEKYRTFNQCASLYLDAKKAYETELDKHIVRSKYLDLSFVFRCILWVWASLINPLSHAQNDSSPYWFWGIFCGFFCFDLLLERIPFVYDR